MRIVTLASLLVLAAPAAAERAPTVLRVGGASLRYSDPIVVQQRDDTPRDHEFYDFLSGGETILTAHFGGQIRFPSAKAPRRAPYEDTFNTQAAKTVAWGKGTRRSRETLVELRGVDWPKAAYFFYHGISAQGAAKADLVIETIRAAPKE